MNIKVEHCYEILFDRRNGSFTFKLQRRFFVMNEKMKCWSATNDYFPVFEMRLYADGTHVATTRTDAPTQEEKRIIAELQADNARVVRYDAEKMLREHLVFHKKLENDVELIFFNDIDEPETFPSRLQRR